MAILVDLQYAYRDGNTPDRSDIENWLTCCLKDLYENAEVTVRIVDERESAELNRRFRNTEGPTNVLSFPSTVTEMLEPELLGDIVICAPVVEQEAHSQEKQVDAHWAHMIVHGALHLAGYDHVNENDAMKMEAQEVRILKDLGFRNPYI